MPLNPGCSSTLTHRWVLQTAHSTIYFVLAFARSLGEFGATISFAGNIEGVTQTLPLAIFSEMQIPGHESSTTRLVVVSVLLSLLAMIIAEYLNKRVIKSKTA